MAVLIRPRLWGKTTPAPGSRINWGHPLAEGLAFATLLNTNAGMPVELVSGALATTGTGTWHQRGRLYSASSSTVDEWSAGTALWQSANMSGVTLACSAVKDSDLSLGFEGLLVVHRGSGNQYALQNSAGQTIALWVNDASVIADMALAANGTEAVYIAGGNNSGRFQERYDDGTVGVSPSAANGDTTALAAPSLGASNFVALGNERSHTRNWPGTIRWAYIWTRALTPDQRRWLVAEPYAFLQAPGPKLQSFSFSSPPLTFGHGDVASTGRAATKVALAVSGHGDTSSAGNAYLRVGTTQPITGHGDIAITGRAALNASLVVRGDGENATTGTATLQLSLPFTGRGNNATTGRADLSEAVDLSGRGAIANTGRTALIEAVGLSGTGAVATTGRVPLIEAVALAGHGDTATAGTATLRLALPLTGDGDIATTGTATLAEQIDLSGRGAIATTGRSALENTLDLSGQGTTANTGRGSPAQLSLGLAGAGTISTTGQIAARLAVSLSGSGANSTAGTATIDVLDGGGHGTLTVTPVTGGSYRTPPPRRRVFSRTIRIRVTLMCELDARPRFFTTTIPTEPQHRSHIRPRRTTTHYKAPVTRCTATGGIRRTNLYADARIETRTTQPKSWRNELLLTAAELLL